MISTLTSCSGQSNNNWKVDIGIRNTGTNMIGDASVSWGKYCFNAGFVAATKEAVHVAFDHPIPETATVGYSLPGGRMITKKLAVKNAVPAAAQKDKDITVMFEVNSNNDDIAVKVLHFIQKDGYAQLVPF